MDIVSSPFCTLGTPVGVKICMESGEFSDFHEDTVTAI